MALRLPLPLLLLAAAAPAPAQNKEPLLTAAATEALAGEVSGAAAKRTIVALSLHHRMRGSTGYNDSAALIAGKLKDYGLAEVETIRLRADGKEIVFSCHLDHPSPGANDNASGCSGILEVARSLNALVASRGPVYRRNPKLKGPMNGFGYSWLDENLAQVGLPRPALLSLTPRGEGASFGYEAFNLVDGRRGVAEIHNHPAASAGRVPRAALEEYLATLERLGVVERVGR